MARLTFRLAVLMGLLATASGWAQPPGPRVGTEFQVNTYTFYNQKNPKVAMGGDGSFMIVWRTKFDGIRGSSAGDVAARRWDASGQPVGEEFELHQPSDATQTSPDVALDESGAGVAVWIDATPEEGLGGPPKINGQRFDSAGQPVGGEFEVITGSSQAQRLAVASGPLGSFVVVWDDSQGLDGSGTGVFARLFDSTGSPVGTEFQVNSYTTDSQQNPDVSVGPGGEFVVVWQSYGSSDSDHDGNSVQGQRFDSGGIEVGGEFQINTYTTNTQWDPAVSMNAQGEFLVVWTDTLMRDGDGATIMGRGFDSDGASVGGEFIVNSYTTANQFYGAVAATDDGNFVVAWKGHDDRVDFGNYEIQGRRVSLSGEKYGLDFQANTYTVYDKDEPAVAAGPDGKFVIVWQDPFKDGSLSGIFGQQFQIPYFADDFESGDTTVWD